MAGNLQTFREKWITLGSCLVAALSPLGASNAQSIPPQYQFALQRAQYQVLMVDVNGDGILDVLVKAQLNITFVDISVLTPIVLKPASPTFVLLSSGGTYTLTANPKQDAHQSPCMAGQ